MDQQSRPLPTSKDLLIWSAGKFHLLQRQCIQSCCVHHGTCQCLEFPRGRENFMTVHDRLLPQPPDIFLLHRHLAVRHRRLGGGKRRGGSDRHVLLEETRHVLANTCLSSLVQWDMAKYTTSGLVSAAL
ncbi:hypothetical protein BaRGS_00020692 [Batillaria attramentaria]|uniref:Uncharacterized protein n=1 Tax=Batillaria attramentaria TaxID=370345 RepID=A0ABD0JEM2_9CAEN